MRLIITRFLVPALIACAPLAAESFGSAKMYAERNHKLQLVAVSIDVQDDALVATIGGKNPEIVEIPYAGITAMEYERSAHRRWKTGCSYRHSSSYPRARSTGLQ